MSSRSLPARPTKGNPVASSFSPGPSPTSTSGEYGSPLAKTVFVRVIARSHLVQTETCLARSSSLFSRFSPPSAASKRLSKAPPDIRVLVLFYTARLRVFGREIEHHSVQGGGQVFRGLSRPQGHRFRSGRGRGRRRHRAEWVGQEHAPAVHQRPRDDNRRRAHGGRLFRPRQEDRHKTAPLRARTGLSALPPL